MGAGIMLSNLIIGPLKLLFEVLFALSNRVLNEGLSIVMLSLAVNILVLPLYRRADAMQEEERQAETRLAPMVRHIRSTFRGDEQMMILQAYYRQNHYSPLHALKGAVPLLLQIPFFIAAYQFLSQLGCLRGTAFGPISDLSLPDQLLRLGTITLNVLPILMTAINLISGALYTHGAPLKSKIQLWAMALVFLALLYDSPAGLTFYWTLNNLFSLGKNIVQKLCSRKKQGKERSPERTRRLLSGKPQPGLFFLCCLVLAVLTGLLIPSAVVADSPQDFIGNITDPDPIWYIVNAFILASGTFLLWFGVFYMLGSPWQKKGMEYGVWTLSGISLVNYLFFRNNLGTISSMLKYDITPVFTTAQKLVNLGILALAALVLIILMARREKLVRGIAWVLILTLGGMAGRNLWITERESSRAFQAQARNFSGETEIPLSREGQNVIVLMLDRAISCYLPCILYEKPELAEVFSGFTYYPNTLSFGASTNFGAPPIFGGYEYTPKAMNARNTELLRDKHNEALLLMPTLFGGQGYRISIFDVPYPGDYSLNGDFSLFDSLPNTNARILTGAAKIVWEHPENLRLRNFFCYSLTMAAPTVLFGTLYDWAHYNQANGAPSFFSLNGDLTALDYDTVERMQFQEDYEVLCSLKEMTTIIPEKTDTLLMMTNYSTHEPVTLPEPEYAPVRKAENEAYDAAHADRFNAGPFPIRMTTEYQMAHYHVNMAALLRIGEWLNYLKEMGVYDNTRIIMVADHGSFLQQIEEGLLETDVENVNRSMVEPMEDVMAYNPLLMVKDFGADGEIRTDTSFMTNADVPTLAMKGLIADPVNPFTGKAVTDQDKTGISYVTLCHAADVGKDKGNVFDPAYWFAVTPGGETLFDSSRWTLIPELE